MYTSSLPISSHYSLARNIVSVKSDMSVNKDSSELKNEENLQKNFSLKEIKVVLSDICSDRDEKCDKRDKPEKVGLRRGKRLRNVSKLVQENSVTKQKHQDNFKSDSDSESSCDEIIEKSTALFGEEDVEGKKLFGFKSRYRKDAIIRKALESAMETPQTPKTPTHKFNKDRKSVTFSPCTPKNSNKVSAYEKTPRRVRNRIQRGLQKIEMEISEGSDFEDSGSDFQPSDESESSDEKDLDKSSTESEKVSDNSDDDFEVKIKPKKMSKQIESDETISKPYNLRRVRGDRDNNFIVKSDNYFSMYGSKKIVTSNHTLERLKTPRLTESNLQTILKEQKLSSVHKKAIEELTSDHKKLFDRWLYYLSEGYSILLHGVGSKRELMQSFQKEKLSDYPCIVINGFFPSLTLKDILDSILSDLLDINSIPSNVYEAVNLIKSEMENIPEEHLFLLIHNIDSSMLKNNKAQTILSRIAKIKNMHLVTSIDNINAPLIWDHSKLSNFNFCWWDVTTLLPYTQETSFESSLLINKSGTLALSSLTNVFRSLTSNAKGIFNLIATNQIKNKSTPHYPGISFKDLYWSARESFLVSSDLALRAQLTEFLDHKLLKQRRGADGIENLYIPIDNNLLQQFLEQNDKN